MVFLWQDSVTLPYSVSTPVVSIQADGTWLVADRFGSGYAQLDADGQLIRRVDYGSGQGPGEFRSPIAIFQFASEQKVLVVDKYGKTLVFDAQTGEFLQTIISHLPHAEVVPWDDRHLFYIWAGTGQDGRYEHTVINLDGDVKSLWSAEQPQWQKHFIYVTSRGHVLDQQRNILIGRGDDPSLYVYPYQGEDGYGPQQLWRLKPPKGYREPPKQNLTERDRFNKEKIQRYFTSFSSIYDIYAVDKGRYLIVAWHNPDQRPQSYDVYQIEDRELLSSDHEVEGFFAAASRDYVVTITYEDDDELPDQVRTKFLLYPTYLEDVP